MSGLYGFLSLLRDIAALLGGNAGRRAKNVYVGRRTRGMWR
jgi:hypothetical protein